MTSPCKDVVDGVFFLRKNFKKYTKSFFEWRPLRISPTIRKRDEKFECMVTEDASDYHFFEILSTEENFSKIVRIKINFSSGEVRVLNFSRIFEN